MNAFAILGNTDMEKKAFGTLLRGATQMVSRGGDDAAKLLANKTLAKTLSPADGMPFRSPLGLINDPNLRALAGEAGAVTKAAPRGGSLGVISDPRLREVADATAAGKAMPFRSALGFINDPNLRNVVSDAFSRTGGRFGYNASSRAVSPYNSKIRELIENAVIARRGSAERDALANAVRRQRKGLPPVLDINDGRAVIRRSTPAPAVATPPAAAPAVKPPAPAATPAVATPPAAAPAVATPPAMPPAAAPAAAAPAAVPPVPAASAPRPVDGVPAGPSAAGYAGGILGGLGAGYLGAEYL